MTVCDNLLWSVEWFYHLIKGTSICKQGLVDVYTVQYLSISGAVDNSKATCISRMSGGVRHYDAQISVPLV
jgi:hypothetical protein